MGIITKEMTINQIIREHPEVTGVFNKFKVDSCCGGARTLEQTAKDDKIDLDALLGALNEASSPTKKTVTRKRG